VENAGGLFSPKRCGKNAGSVPHRIPNYHSDTLSRFALFSLCLLSFRDIALLHFFAYNAGRFGERELLQLRSIKKWEVGATP